LPIFFYTGVVGLDCHCKLLFMNLIIVFLLGKTCGSIERVGTIVKVIHKK